MICATCGTQYPTTPEPPPQCAICADPRQFVGFDGQQWTTPEELRAKYRNIVEEVEPGCYSIRTEPHFGIGQRAFLIQTPEGNVLWDCLALLDDGTMETLRELGGIAAIAISHPHYYTTMVEWSVAFDNAPVYLHAADSQWIMRAHDNIRSWRGDTQVLPGGLTLIHTPGHFAGFQVLLWPAGAEGKGALFSGDQPQVCLDRRWVSFMWSYPNYVPLPMAAVNDIVARLARFGFDRIHGAFHRRSVMQDAQEVIRLSAARFGATHPMS